MQVGELLRLFITKVPGDSPRVFINPDILETSIEQEPFEEGCLSIPGLYTDVIRPPSVRIQAWNARAARSRSDRGRIPRRASSSTSSTT